MNFRWMEVDVAMLWVYLKHIESKDIKRMKVITFFKSFLLQSLTPFIIHICTKISISTWKMKLPKLVLAQ